MIAMSIKRYRVHHFAGYILVALLSLIPLRALAQSGSALLSLPVATAHRGESIVVPLRLDNLAGRALAAAEIEVRFDAQMLSLEGIEAAGALAQSWQVQHVIRADGENQIVHAVLTGVESIATDGELLSLVFRVDAAAPFAALGELEIAAAALEQPPTGDLLSVRWQHGGVRVGVPPGLWTNEVLRVDEGQSAAIDGTLLEVRDADSEAGELRFVLVDVPDNGSLIGLQGPLGAGSRFSQADVNGGILRYGHNGGETTEDVFAFSVSDGGGTPLTGVFSIRINPINDLPALVALGDVQVNEGQSLDIDVEASDPDGTPLISAAGLPPFASLIDGGDGRALLRLTPNYEQAGTYNIELVATDDADAALIDREAIVLTVNNINRAPLAAAGADGQYAYVTANATPVVLDGSVSRDPDGDALSYRWLENGAQIATGPTPTVSLAIGRHIISLIVNDGALDSVPDQVLIDIVDGTPPVLTLLGDNPLYVERGTSYAEPGASALDEIDGDLSASVSISGTVDETVEGSYVLSYEVADAAGNANAPIERIVEVVVTPNSYVLLATNSMEIKARAQVYSGFVGVNDYGQRPFRGGRAALGVGTRAEIAENVRVSAPRVQIKNRAEIAGTLVYSEQMLWARSVDIGQEQQVGTEYWPLFETAELPPFRGAAAGGLDVDVRGNRTQTLFAFNNSYGEVRVRARGTLILAGGDYRIASLRVDQGANVVVQAPAELLIEGQFQMGEEAYLGPQNGDVDPADIRVFVNGSSGGGGSNDNGEDDDEILRVQVGEKARFLGNLYAPNSVVELGAKSELVGAVIGRDLVVGTEATVSLRSGWKMSGVQYDPPLWTAAKLVSDFGSAELQGETGELVSYPNPFNPSTTLRYALSVFGPVQLSVYSALGQKVRVLVDQVQPAGHYEIEWDGRDGQARAVASGVYLVHLRGEHVQRVHKLVLMR